MTALRYLLGAVAGCAAPLWCRVRGHGPFGARYPFDGVWRRYCIKCGEWV